MDVKTSVNKIGEIVNLSQELNSQFWHNRKYNMNLYYDICKLAVLSGLEIDSAKREVPVNSSYEIKVLKNKYKLKNKPYFFKMITLENGYKLNRKTQYIYFHTSMDYLQKVINRFSKRLKPEYASAPFYTLINSGNIRLQGFNYDKRGEIVTAIREFNREMERIFSEKNFEYAKRLKSEFIDFVGSQHLSKETMYLLLKLLDNPAYSDIRNILLEVLFKTKNQAFLTLIKESANHILAIRESNTGDINIYGKCYKIITI